MSKVVPGNLQDFDCQSLKLGRQISPGTPSSPVREQNLSLTQGIAQLPHSPGLAPQAKTGRAQGGKFSLRHPVGFDYRVSILKAQYSEVKTPLYLYVSSEFQSCSLEILRESFLLTQFNPGCFVGTKTCENLVSSPTFFSLPPKSVAGSFCQSGPVGAYLPQI